MKPLITLIKQKEKFYEMAIQSILKEEILWSLHGKGTSQFGSLNQDPVSAGQRFFTRGTKGGADHACLQKESIAAFFNRAIAGASKNSS